MKLSNAARGGLTLLGCAAFVIVFLDLGERLHLGGAAIRFPLLAVLLGCFTPSKGRLITGLQVMTLAALAPAAVVALWPGLEGLPPSGAQLTLEAACAAALAVLCAAQLVRAWSEWRKHRARMKAQYPSPVQRASGGF